MKFLNENGLSYFWGKIQTALNGLRSTQHSTTLLASGWIDGQYTYNNEHITATNILEMNPGIGITLTELTALQKANLVGVNQAAGTITLHAFGTIPTADIPVQFIVRGDLA